MYVLHKNMNVNIQVTFVFYEIKIIWVTLIKFGMHIPNINLNILWGFHTYYPKIHGDMVLGLFKYNLDILIFYLFPAIYIYFNKTENLEFN